MSGFLFTNQGGKKGKKERLLHGVVSLLLTLLVAFTSLFPQAAVLATPGTPKVISYQGRLYDASGNLLSRGSRTSDRALRRD